MDSISCSTVNLSLKTPDGAVLQSWFSAKISDRTNNGASIARNERQPLIMLTALAYGPEKFLLADRSTSPGLLKDGF